ncbi:MAG: hypothetical protein Fur0025_20810 [Oscillatoriaceae cyanobacterium]
MGEPVGCIYLGFVFANAKGQSKLLTGLDGIGAKQVPHPKLGKSIAGMNHLSEQWLDPLPPWRRE